MESVTPKEEHLEVISLQPLSRWSLMVSGNTPTSPLVAFALLNPVTLSSSHSFESYQVLDCLLQTVHSLEQICEESLSCFSNGMSNNRDILGAHLFCILAEVKDAPFWCGAPEICTASRLHFSKPSLSTQQCRFAMWI